VRYLHVLVQLVQQVPVQVQLLVDCQRNVLRAAGISCGAMVALLMTLLVIKWDLLQFIEH
jgi:hypothetical protein